MGVGGSLGEVGLMGGWGIKSVPASQLSTHFSQYFGISFPATYVIVCGLVSWSSAGDRWRHASGCAKHQHHHHTVGIHSPQVDLSPIPIVDPLRASRPPGGSIKGGSK